MRHVLLCPRKEDERVLLEVNFNLSLPDLIVKELIIGTADDFSNLNVLLQNLRC